MLSILINAYACSPNMGSEPGMAWNWCINLAQYCELHIITEGEFRDKIEQVLPSLPQGKNMHFYYNPLSDKIRRMCWNQGDWRFYYYYKKWQKETLKIAEKIIQQTHIDIIHQLNMVGFREPGYLWKIEKPLIWGPIAGIGSIPYSFLKGGGMKYTAFFLLKNFITKLQLRYSPRVKQIIKKAHYVITATQEAQAAIQNAYNIKTILINETGCFTKQEVIDTKKDNETFDILWVGRFIYTKQLKLALETIARLKNLKGIKFHIVGQAFTDEETQAYHQYADSLGISDLCKWYNFIPNKEVHLLMQKCHLFFFTSIFEATSTVILEAITNHLPIVCFDRCGFGPIVSKEIGIKIPLTIPKQAISDFAEKITYLYQHREILQALSEGCKDKQKELSWENKAKHMIELYKTCVNQ